VDTAKGQDVLVKALPEMVAVKPELYVVFVGPMTKFGQHLPGEVEAMGLGQHVAFVGARDDAYSFIRASNMLIHPSRAEGQGLVVLEAMVLRTPILATDVGGIPFSIQHGRSGWLVPPNDPGAIAEGFRTLAQNPSLRERLVAEAEARYWENFSRLKHRERIQSVIKSCLAQGAHTKVD
jgi:glycosyltransferase involved in cell wall biosynthesis